MRAFARVVESHQAMAGRRIRTRPPSKRMARAARRHGLRPLVVWRVFQASNRVLKRSDQSMATPAPMADRDRDLVAPASDRKVSTAPATRIPPASKLRA